MIIFLNDDWNFIHASKIADKIYSVNERDRKVIDEKFDKLHRKDKMKWSSISTFFDFLIFVVWRTITDSNNKSMKKHRVMTNIKELNKLITTNDYFILIQKDIIELIKKCEHINLINDLTFFLQFLIIV